MASFFLLQRGMLAHSCQNMDASTAVDPHLSLSDLGWFAGMYTKFLYASNF